jgi:glycosyltransferase involved in cell wall biosynthesis
MKIVVAASNGNSLINFRGKLISEMVKRGNEVICISYENDKKFIDDVHALGAKYQRVPMTRTGTNFLKDLYTLLYFYLILKKLKPDMYFAYMAKPIAYGGLAAKICKVKKINILVSGLEVAFYSSGFKNKIVRYILKTLFRIVHNSAENVFFQNPDDMNTFIKMKIVSQNQSILVNGSGVDMSHFTKKIMPKQDSVLMVARLVWSKGVREYIEAAKKIKLKHPNSRIILVGGLDENPEALSKEDLDTIVKSGIIEYQGYAKDVCGFLEECSIFVLPSYHEGTPRSVLEAMATGRPIITTNAPGCRETVIEGVNGFLVPVSNSEKLAERIIWLIENRLEAERMGEESYRICKEKYDVNKVNKEILTALKL